ncbi:MAG: c-type cytochrome [Rhodobacteraceae bacterium]|nr:MAG: c-type cytochrome [Paracoccaceae bacterium]
MRALAPIAVVVLLGAFGSSASAELLGDAEAGERLYTQCKGCHEVGKGAENRIGPHLNSLFGRRAAGLEDFRYSDSMKRAGNSGIEWHADTLDSFLANPRSIASGTRMSYRGMKKPEDRANLIAYLRTFSDNPANIPEADPTARMSEYTIDPALLAMEGDPEYGEYLSGECTTCHQVGGGDDGIPSIVLWPQDDFKLAMHAYKSGQRIHPVMQMIASRLGDEEIAALAAYFENPE